MEIDTQSKQAFIDTLWEFYAHGRRADLPWRQPEPNGSFDPYKIMVSELMLQQTQVARVVAKYKVFLQYLPDVDTLAQTELGDVLRIWQGLGYNRRAKFLWQAAQVITSLDLFPESPEALLKLPGVGVNTAGAIAAYSYNYPAVFIETNIRTVYIHHFFPDCTDVSDKAILQLVVQTLDYENPREFYWALMDYGSHLKATIGNLNTISKQYVKQSTFHGSRRQVRGKVIRALSIEPHTLRTLQAVIQDERLGLVLRDLLHEGMIRKSAGKYSL